MSLFSFKRPLDKPKPSVKNEVRVLRLSSYDIDTIRAIANKIEYDLRHLSRKPVMFSPRRITENMRNAIITEMASLSDESDKGTREYVLSRTVRISVSMLDDIRLMLFEFEMWLTDESMRMSETGAVFRQVMKDYEHCRLIRRRLITTEQIILPD